MARNVGELETEHLSAIRNLVKGNKNAVSVISTLIFFAVCYRVLFSLVLSLIHLESLLDNEMRY
jgi:hypothetical protein